MANMVDQNCRSPHAMLSFRDASYFLGKGIDRGHMVPHILETPEMGVARKAGE
jgi:DNA/RNA endonuclease G (NUC1)